MLYKEPMTERAGSETPVQLCERLKLPFGDDLRLLTRALTHRSYVNEHPDVISDNERLEFLGDAVLDFVVGAWVYNHYPEMAEGELTRMRSALVRTETLAEFSRKLNLGQAMRLGRGELQGGGRDRDILLCATFESLVGAMYQRRGLEETRNFIMPLLEPMAETILTQMQTIDPKSRLQEFTQSRGWGIPRYATTQSDGPDHARVFVIEVYINSKSMGKGSGPSKHAAQLCAAQHALENFAMLDTDSSID
ncbi:MAG: ribonuclease III [Chloroflexi bacterium]|nr:ribonuclease III [Chloroflexota bacterium]